MKTDLAADLAQSLALLLETAQKLRESHSAAVARAKDNEGAQKAAQAAVEALEALLESEAAVRAKRALTRYEWGR